VRITDIRARYIPAGLLIAKVADGMSTRGNTVHLMATSIVDEVWERISTWINYDR
jgi:hypothetical protein